MNLGGTVHLNRVGVCVVFFCFLIVALYMTRDVEDSDMKKIQTVNLKHLLLTAVKLAEKGGEQVVQVRNYADIRIQSKGKTSEGANNPVTEADYNSHCVMYFGLKKSFPTLTIISEEKKTEAECGNLVSPALTMQSLHDSSLDNLIDEEVSVKDVTVWIDPLDATQEFTENLLEYVTTLVCVAFKGQSIIGVIHQPFGNHPSTSWAWLKRGMSADLMSFKNVQSNPAVIVSRSHSGAIEDIVHEALGEETPIIKAGGAGYKIMQVVSGNASAYIHSTSIKKWDICAGDAVLTAVGGTMTSLTNEEINYSASAESVNRDGLLATLKNHQQYAMNIHKALQKDMHL